MNLIITLFLSLALPHLIQCFPEDFRWGVALSAHQNCGAEQLPHSNWSFWEKQEGHIKNNQKSGIACDHWNRYHEDIELIKNLGLTDFRFSVDWSAIEPQEGEFNQAALDYYSDFCDALLRAGIKIMVTLHHFTHPQWFEELGAFEKEENIRYFVRFSQKIYEQLHTKVDLWCTINEPTILVLQGYFRGVFPPGKMNPFLGLTVLRNLLKAHTDVYNSLKKMAKAKNHNVQIGLVHQYLKAEPYNSWNVLERIPGYLFNYLLNDTVLEFCATGTFKVNFWAPQIVSALLPKGIDYLSPNFFGYTTPSGTKALDFFGLNYYSRVVPHHQPKLTNPFHIIPSCGPHEIMTDMPYGIYAQGFYNALVDVAKIGVPIYVTENGIADAQDKHRKYFLKQYLAALERAVNENYTIKGYYYWTLLDNFEWDEGYDMKFGLYHVDFVTQKRTLRKGSQYYRKFVQRARAR